MSSSPQIEPETSASSNDIAVDAFITRWSKSEASERANYQLFLAELCQILKVPLPDPSTSEDHENAYVFERRVLLEGKRQKEEGESGGGEVVSDSSRPPSSATYGFIDLYKRGCFILETKQGVERKEKEALSEAGREREAKRRKGHGTRGTAGFDQVLIKAKNQAERYVRGLSVSEGRPPFVVIVDVGHSFELYAEFTRTGGFYSPFPDARSYRFQLTDLRRPEIRERLRLLWTEPLSLDPARRTAAVTREVSVKLAALSKSLEASGHPPEIAAYFLMRCIFTMFAEDVGLLPEHGFSKLLADQRGHIPIVPMMLETLWRAMDTGDFCAAEPFKRKLLRFNGGLFREPRALAITGDQLELLIEAAKADWRDVEPAIFGTLLERALEPTERHKLGAHYTPRAYVERLVLPTVIAPLRADWEAVQAAAAQLVNEDKESEARAEVEEFHRQLCHIRVLDPACGTGNFLYVTLEHLKRLEGEVLDTLERFGGNRILEMDTATVRPNQMRGIEINPRAAVIAELVLWIGYLQWHLRAAGDIRTVSEPVLEDAKNIESRDALLAYDRKEVVCDESGRPQTHWDGRTTKSHPVTGRPVPDENVQIPLYNYVNPRAAEWPQADFIIGNPPFIGKGKIREALGDGYVEALRKTIKSVPDSADFVMYWWNHAAEIVRAGKARRFGFVTTNSIRQTFNRRILETHLTTKNPLSLIYAIPDHPWIDDVEAAAVRVAMTVAEADNVNGLLQTVESEESGDESYKVTLSQHIGKIRPNLTIGPDLDKAVALHSNEKISGTGLILGGRGFVLSLKKRDELVARCPKSEDLLFHLRNGGDLMGSKRNFFVIDTHGWSEARLRSEAPEVWQHLYETVYPERQTNRDPKLRVNWWLFRRSNELIRSALMNLPRFISTSETSKYRVFTFLDSSVKPEHKLVNIGSDDAWNLGVLSSRIHVAWAIAKGGWLGVGNDSVYSKTTCFETFPFPACTDAQKTRIREIGEALDAHRKSRQTAHPELTMTGMYNVLEKLRSGDPLTAKEKILHEHGLVSILQQLHDELDAAVADGYGWSADLTEEEILTRLVALNHSRAEEEKRGHIRYLRPEYQAPGQKSEVRDQQSEQQEIAGITPTARKGADQKLTWPKTLPEQVRLLRQALETHPGPVAPETLAQTFKGVRKDRILTLLETLQALGHAHEAGDGQYTA